MIKHFLNLEWKQYFRSAYWQKSILMNVLLVFFALYMMGIFLMLGFLMVEILDEAGQDPELVQHAPYTMPVRRLDEVKAARELDVSWRE